MRLTNHQKDNSYTIDTYVMRGTITMSLSEYKDAVEYLKRTYTRAVKLCDTYTRDSLSPFSFYYGHIEKPIKPVCFGVCATQLLVTKYRLPNYKDQNYGIVII